MGVVTTYSPMFREEERSERGTREVMGSVDDDFVKETSKHDLLEPLQKYNYQCYSLCSCSCNLLSSCHQYANVYLCVCVFSLISINGLIFFPLFCSLILLQILEPSEARCNSLQLLDYTLQLHATSHTKPHRRRCFPLD